MRLGFAIFLFSAGCGYAVIGAGPPPRLHAPRPITLEVDVAGEPQALMDDAVQWILKGDTSMKRVRAGGDARVRLEGKLSEQRAILAGTDARFRMTLVAVRGNEEVLRDAHEWQKQNIGSGLYAEEEHLVVDAVAWALGRAAATLGDQPPPAAAPPEPVVNEPPPSYDDTPTPIPAPKKKHRR